MYYFFKLNLLTFASVRHHMDHQTAVPGRLVVRVPEIIFGGLLIVVRVRQHFHHKRITIVGHCTVIGLLVRHHSRQCRRAHTLLLCAMSAARPVSLIAFWIVSCVCQSAERHTALTIF